MTEPEQSSSADEAPDPYLRRVFVMLVVVLGGCGAAAAVYYWVTRQLVSHHAGYWAKIAATLAFGAAVLAIVWFAKRAAGFKGRDCSPAARRYQRWMLVAAAAYMLTLAAAIAIHDRLHPSGLIAYAVAVAPSIPLVAVIARIGIYMREEPDEFLRAVQAEAALWATGGTLAVASVWGFLESFELVGHVEAWAAFPLWCLLLIPGQLIARRRYR